MSLSDKMGFLSLAQCNWITINYQNTNNRFGIVRYLLFLDSNDNFAQFASLKNTLKKDNNTTLFYQKIKLSPIYRKIKQTNTYIAWI